MNFSSLRNWKWGVIDNTWLYNIRVPQYADFYITNEYSGSFIVNEFQLVKVAILMISAHILFVVIYYVSYPFRKRNKPLKRVCWRIQRFFTLEIYLLVAFESYMFILIHSLAESYGEFPTPNNTISYVTATIIFFGIILLLLIVPIHFFWARKKKDHRLKNGMMSFIYKDMKIGRTWPSMYYLWFGVRRIVMALVVVFFSLTLTFYINTGFWVVV